MRYHHAPASGWINDPLALTWHDGRYHLFFQHVPDSTAWRADCRWGHATSTDLLTWDSAPVALEPGDEETGCWSGSIAVDGAEVVLFYTAVDEPDLDRGRIRRAVPRDEQWLSWDKQEVVVTAPPEATHFRDPFVQRHGAGWRMVVGASSGADVGTAWVWTSDDLATWTYAGVLASRAADVTEGTWTGVGWECPQLVEVDGEEVLVVSVWEPGALHHVAYRVGDQWSRLSYGPSHYAGSVFAHADGSPGLVTWLREVEGPGWSGATSLPMSLHLDGERLVARPPAGAPVTEWRPGVALPGCALDPGDGVVTVTGSGAPFDLPWDGGPLHVVVDEGVVEIYGRLGIAAVPVAALTE